MTKDFTLSPSMADALESKLLANTDKNGPISEHRPDLGPCWIWLGPNNGRGYGSIYFTGNKRKPAHMISFTIKYGYFPAGLVPDHLCRNRICVNPDHIEPVTSRVNILRGVGPTAIAAKRTHCPFGHAYDAENTAPIFRNGKYAGRRCKACDKWMSEKRLRSRSKGDR